MLPNEIPSRRRVRQLLGGALTVAILTLSGACSEPAPPAPTAQRLVDVFGSDLVDGSPPAAGAVASLEWRFDGPAPETPPAARAATRGWEPLRDVDGLALRGGRLVGRTASAGSLLRFERPAGPTEDDLLHHVEVRLRASAGSAIHMHLIGPVAGEFDRGALADPGVPLPIRAPLAPGDEVQTYALTSPMTLRGGQIRQILMRPTDAAGADFEIESVRLVLRREHLAGIPSGIGWHGLSDVYRETVVSRAPETLRWRVRLPEKPQLDLALGTLDERPVTFRVTVEPEGGGAGPVRLLERTITTPHQWDVASFDLAAFAGRKAVLSLTLAAGDAGTLGLWGSPVIRGAGVPPARRAGGVSQPPPQVVLFILTDTLRRDRLEVYGHSRPTAPTLARLAAEGALFDDVIAQGTWTKISVPSLLSSAYVTTTGVTDFSDRLPSSALTLAEAYRQAGYATAGYVSIPFAGRASNLHQGFEEMHERTFELDESKTARGFVDLLLPWLDRHRGVPVFVFLHFLDPHSPYRPARPWDTQWADPAWRSQHERQKQEIRQFIRHPLRRTRDIALESEVREAGADPDAYMGRELDWYDGSIRAMDVEIGRVFERLADLGLDDKTLAVVVSDHGEEFLEHGRMFHGQSVYGELTNVPLVLWYPGVVPPGARVDDTVQLIDVMPTLLELSGLPIPPSLQGQSAVPLLARADGDGGLRAAGRWQARPAISEKPTAMSPFVPPPLHTESTALVFEGWKLIHHSKRDGDTPEYELFDHANDPLDRTDVAPDHPQVVERLAGLMTAWREAAASQRFTSDTAAVEGMSPAELDRLRALGYVP